MESSVWKLRGGGYASCDLRVNKLQKTYLDAIKSVFGEQHLLNHRDVFTNSMNGNMPASHAYYDSILEIPSEIMMFGTKIVSSHNGPNGCGTTARTQLAAFRNKPDLIKYLSPGYWLRDITESNTAALVFSDGNAAKDLYDRRYCVRPVFGLIG